MRLLMVTPRVGVRNTLLAFIPAWVTHLARRVEHLYVVTPRAEAIQLPENVTVIEVGRDYSKGETVFHATRNFHRALWDLTRHKQVDGVFTHMYPIFTLLAGPYARLRRLPLVMWYTHTHVSQQLRLAARFADRIITASPGSCRLRSPRVVVVGHGIDTQVFHPPDRAKQPANSPWRLLSVGRISPSKHYETILEAARLLSDHPPKPGFQLQIVGEPANSGQQPYLESLKKQVANQGLESVVNFTGRIEHHALMPTYQDADLFLSASQTGLDKAVLEAMACGAVPVLSLEEFRPTLGEYASMLMYPPGNAAAMAGCIQNLMAKDPDEYRSISRAMAALVMEKHNLDGLMDRLVGQFRELCLCR